MLLVVNKAAVCFGKYKGNAVFDKNIRRKKTKRKKYQTTTITQSPHFVTIGNSDRVYTSKSMCVLCTCTSQICMMLFEKPNEEIKIV